MGLFEDDGDFMEEYKNSDDYSTCLHRAIDILKKHVPESRPQWAVDYIAVRLATAELFIKKTGHYDEYLAFMRKMADEETKTLAPLADSMSFSSGELDFMLEQLEDADDHDDGKPGDGDRPSD